MPERGQLQSSQTSSPSAKPRTTHSSATNVFFVGFFVFFFNFLFLKIEAGCSGFNTTFSRSGFSTYLLRDSIVHLEVEKRPSCTLQSRYMPSPPWLGHSIGNMKEGCRSGISPLLELGGHSYLCYSLR